VLRFEAGVDEHLCCANRNNTNDNDDDNPVININKPIVSTFSASPSILALARSEVFPASADVAFAACAKYDR
jgi:hypothetical protein